MEQYTVKHLISKEEIEEAFDIRRKVFVIEQQISPEMERDDLDENAEHFLAYADGQAVAAARLLVGEQDIKLGRMAVLDDYRRQGVGRALFRAMLDFARNSKARRIVLNSQASARTFYFAMGFTEEGAPFIESGIPHQMMVMEFAGKR